ncbi:hypothetical protein ACTI_84340 [Actinoplanes sp. OR16]|nr:hypothetical protein ACTI_84340 [Actinoplanes sp. OR16]
MPIERLDDPEFWRAYFFEAEIDEDEDDDEDEDGEELVVEFAVGGGHALVLDIDLELTSVELGLRTPDNDEILELGWDDQAHWHPHALRWAELDLIGRAAAVIDPGLRHPGPVLALASRFVALGPDDDLDAITPLMDAAYDVPWPTTRDWLDRADFRDQATTWRQDEAGNWTVDQDDAQKPERALYSLRRPGGSFPFAAWRRLLAAAEATVATRS